MKEDKSRLLEVYRGTMWEADLLRSMLADNGIEAVTKDSLVVNCALPANVVDVVVLINEADAEDAARVVSEFEKNKVYGTAADEDNGQDRQ